MPVMKLTYLYFVFAFSALMLLDGQQEWHPGCKNWVVTYWHGYLSGARRKWLAYGPADATATPASLAEVKSRMVYLSGAGLPRLSWKKAICSSVVYRTSSSKTIPGYNLPIFSISDVSNPATTAPPTGTRKFLSVDWTNTSTRPTRWACIHAHMYDTCIHIKLRWNKWSLSANNSSSWKHNSDIKLTELSFLCLTQNKIGHLETFFPAKLLA